MIHSGRAAGRGGTALAAAIASILDFLAAVRRCEERLQVSADAVHAVLEP